MAQLSVNATMPGLQRGMPIGSSDYHNIVSRFNQRSETRTVAITYSAAQTHTLVIVGAPHGGGPAQTVTVGPITGDTDSATTAQALLVAIRASAVANSIVSVTRSSATLTLVARRAGPLTVTGTASGGGATTVATTVSETQMEAGVMAVKDTSGDKYIRPPFTPTAKVITLTALSAANSTVYNFSIYLPRTGQTWLVEVTSDGSATDAELVTLLVAKVNAMAVPVTAADGTGDTVVLTSDVAGEDFEVLEVETVITQATTTANVRPDPDGITLWPKAQDIDQSLTTNNVWPSRFDVSLMRKGRIGVYVDQAVVPGDKVFFRNTASGANTVLGALRKDSDSGTAQEMPLGSAALLTSASAGAVAELEINLP